MDLTHLSWRTDNGEVLFDRDEDVVRGAAAIVRVPGADVLWFCVADNHLHVVAKLGRFPRVYVRNLGFALQVVRPSLLMRPAHLRAVDGVRHLENLAEYVPRNPEHHGLAGAYALAPGNCIADFLGARLLPGFDRNRWRAYLPRWELKDWLARAGLPPEVEGVAADADIREQGAWALAKAVTAVIGRPDLARRTPMVTAAREACVGVGLASGLPRAELAAALGVRVDSIRRIDDRANQPALAEALRRRVHLERVLRTIKPLPRRRDRQD